MTTAKGQRPRQHGELSEAVAALVLMERSGRRWSREEMGRRAGLSPKTIQRIEDKARVPDVTQLHRLAGALGMTTSELIRRGEDRVRQAGPDEAALEDVSGLVPADEGASPRPGVE